MRHPDDVPRFLDELSVYLKQTYSLKVSTYSLGRLVRLGVLPASKVNVHRRGRWRTTASAYFAAMDPAPQAEVPMGSGRAGGPR